MRIGRSAVLGVVLGLAWTALAVAVLAPTRTAAGRATPALVLVIGVVIAGLAGGVLAAGTVAVVAAAVLNFAFIPPYGTFKVDAWEDWVALAVFLAVASALGMVVAGEGARRRAAQEREAELRSLYDQLNAVTAERSQLAEEAARAQLLAQVDQHRSALLRSVSHDLRTPLATIRAVATDLRDGAQYDDATRAELLGTVCDESERLDRIVANLLSLSRIEAGAFTPERQAVPVDELVGERVRRLRPLFQKVRVQIDLAHDLPLVDADYTQLDLVVTNLLENAARHAPPGSTVLISGRPRGEVVEVRIADEGIGVPEWAATSVFEPFRRGEKGGSSGVGLAICKAIIEAHHGRIWVDRTVGGGATFVFTVPVHR
ncbi:MAG: sensor histidine kinase [Acidimicrobiales bacterium]